MSRRETTGQDQDAALEAYRAAAYAEADAHFDDRALEAQRHKILSRLEHLEHPAKVIRFPKAGHGENPSVNIIGHLTTRKIGRRDPVDLDLEAVFEAAGRTGTALEINAFPDRLDLRDEHVLWARRHGVKFSIDTDSHAVGHLDVMRFGVATAQRGWLSKDDVINAWPIGKLERFLRKGRSKAAAR